MFNRISFAVIAFVAMVAQSTCHQSPETCFQGAGNIVISGDDCKTPAEQLGIDEAFAVNTDPQQTAVGKMHGGGFSYTPESLCLAACEASELCGGFYFYPGNGRTCAFQSLEQAQDPACSEPTNLHEDCSQNPGGDNCWWNGQWPTMCADNYADVSGSPMHWVCVEDASTTTLATTTSTTTTTPSATTTTPESTAFTTEPVESCPSESWVATEDCVTDELCTKACALGEEYCPAACDCVETFEENPGFCCGGSCHDDYDQLWQFNFHNGFMNILEGDDAVTWDKTTEGCKKLCSTFDLCDAFTVVDDVRCEIVSGFDHIEPASACESCFVKNQVESDGSCQSDTTEVTLLVGGSWDGLYELTHERWVKADRQLGPYLDCCEATGTWGVSKTGDACEEKYTYDDYTFAVGSCCIDELAQFLALFYTTTTTQTPTALPTQAPVEECCKFYEITGLEDQSGKSGIYARVTDLFHDGYPVYQSTSYVADPGQFLFYWAPVQDWVIGPDYEAYMGGVFSTSNIDGCPEQASAWSVLSSTTGNFDPALQATISCYTVPPMA